MNTIDAFMAEHDQKMAAFPGDIECGDLTGHGNEWRTQVSLYSEPDCDESEKEGWHDVLEFSVFESPDGGLTGDLSLNHVMNEQGVVDKSYLAVFPSDLARQSLNRVVREWGIPSEGLDLAEPLMASLAANERLLSSVIRFDQ